MKKPIVLNRFGSKLEFIELSENTYKHKDKIIVDRYNVLNGTFNLTNFSSPGFFTKIGEVKDQNNFSKFNNIRCLDMPIKMAGSNEYRIPKEFLQFLPTIKQMLNFEHTYNDDILNFFAYLTIDQTEPNGSEYHREPGLHVDGFQGMRIQPKVKCDRSYIVVNNNCPSFWNQPFESVISMDDSKQNLFHEFDRTKKPSSEIKIKPYDIMFMDCYAVHSANKIEEEIPRTFVRLSYSVRQFDRLNNSHNNCFDYSWKMVSRNISDVLK